MFQLSTIVESIWIEAFELDKKLDSMLENKSKNTAKVLSSSSEQEKIKSSKNGQKGKNSIPVPVKTLEDFFNPLCKKDLSGDLKAGNTSNSEGLNSLKFGGEGGEGGGDSEDTQSSIMRSVFRHIMR